MRLMPSYDDLRLQFWFQVVAKRPFGVSTHLYHGQRLTREHLLEIAAHGFEPVELFATRTHFDYHNPAAVADLQQWLAEAGLELHSVHAPIGESFSGGRWGRHALARQRRPGRAGARGRRSRAGAAHRAADPVPRAGRALGLPRSQPRDPSARRTAATAARRSIEAAACGWRSRSACGSRSR